SSDLGDLPSRMLSLQHLVSRHDVAKLVGDRALPLQVELAAQEGKAVIDVPLGSVHRGPARRVFAGERLSKGAVQRYEEVLADDRREERLPVHGEGGKRPWSPRCARERTQVG